MSFLCSSMSRMSLVRRSVPSSPSPFLALASPAGPLLAPTTRGIKFAPKSHRSRVAQKGRVPIRTGGSTKGTTLGQGSEFGMRAKKGARLTAKQLELCFNILRRKTKQNKGSKIIMRVFPDRPVCVKGNETRMGKGKGSFEYWACSVPMNHMLFEIKGGNIRPEMAKDMCRIATTVLPIATAYVTPSTLPKCGFNNVAHPPLELVLPPPTPEQLLADQAEEDLDTFHSQPVTVAEKKALVAERERVRWKEFRASLEMAEKEEIARKEAEDKERVAAGNKSKLGVKVVGGATVRRLPQADPRFVVFGSKIAGKGMETSSPGARY